LKEAEKELFEADMKVMREWMTALLEKYNDGQVGGLEGIEGADK